MTDFRPDPSSVPGPPPVPPPPPPSASGAFGAATGGMPPAAAGRVEPWPSEQPLFIFLLLVAACIWLVLVISVIGLAYAALIGLFVFVGHVALIAQLRGSAVRLGPDQFPELHRRVQELARQVGLTEAPDVYVAQEGGALNAFATRFFSRSFIVLYSDLLEACGDNTEARDFVIAHELGHLHMGHLRWQALLLPGAIVPFLWNAYSRAREFTCDRYGLSVARDRQAALRGLAILAAGGRLGSTLRMDTFVRQREDLNRPLMKLGTWLSTHPPLCDRVAALEPALAGGQVLNQSGARLGALALVGGTMGLPFLLMFALIGSIAVAGFRAEQAKVAAAQAAAVAEREAEAQIVKDVMELRRAVDSFKQTNGRLPAQDEFAAAWKATYGDRALPNDPGWDEPYSYETNGTDYLLGSSGANGSYLSTGGGRFGDYDDLELPAAPSDSSEGPEAPARGSEPAPPAPPSR